MEIQKLTNFLDITSDNKDLPRFVNEKWIKVYDQSEGNYNVNNEIRIKTSMLRSDLCDYSNAYIVVKGTITIVRPNGAKRNKEVIFKNNAPFINCISKINGVKIDNANEEGYDAHKVGINETEAVIPLKYLSNFRRSLNIPLINCEVKLILT